MKVWIIVFLHDIRFGGCISNSLTACSCLQAALRRLAAGCPDSIEAADHQQLIKPRLVDSFLLCSNMEESFVWRAAHWTLRQAVSPKDYFLPAALVSHFLCPEWGSLFLLQNKSSGSSEIFCLATAPHQLQCHSICPIYHLLSQSPV